MTNDYIEIIKFDEVAQMMGISVSYFYVLKKNGQTPPQLESFKRPRWSKQVVVAWLQKREIQKREELAKEISEKLELI
jgi:predicted DNA-binding transcriptional regulator AlpA